MHTGDAGAADHRASRPAGRVTIQGRRARILKGLPGTTSCGQVACAYRGINVRVLLSGRVGGPDRGAEKPEEAKAPDRGKRSKVPGQIYDEIQRQFRFHDDANTSLEKKAQNLMIASALVATLFATVSMAGAACCPPWDSWRTGAAVAFLVGTITTMMLCISVNRPLPQPVPIAGGGLLCCDRLDEKTYGELVEDEEEYYKSRIEEYARVLTKQERINKRKAERLKYAYYAFATEIVMIIPVLLIGRV